MRLIWAVAIVVIATGLFVWAKADGVRHCSKWGDEQWVSMYQPSDDGHDDDEWLQVRGRKCEAW